MSGNGNALCEYCDVDSGLGAVDGDAGGVYDGFFSPVWEMLKSLISSIVEILSDLVLWAFCGVMEGILYVANFIELPALVNSLQSVVNSLDPVIGYLILRSGMPEALLVVGGGMSFYVLRKFLTLGKW